MIHPVAQSGAACPVRARRLVIVIVGCLSDRIALALALLLLALLRRIADLDVGELILIISVNSPCDTSGFSRISLFVGVHELALSGLVQLLLLVHISAPHLDSSTVNVDLHSARPRTLPFRLLAQLT